MGTFYLKVLMIGIYTFFVISGDLILYFNRLKNLFDIIYYRQSFILWTGYFTSWTSAVFNESGDPVEYGRPFNKWKTCQRTEIIAHLSFVFSSFIGKKMREKRTVKCWCGLYNGEAKYGVICLNLWRCHIPIREIDGCKCHNPSL